MEDLSQIAAEISHLSHTDKCRLTAMLIDLVYPTPAPGFTVDIVFSCKEKFAEWLRQQI